MAAGAGFLKHVCRPSETGAGPVEKLQPASRRDPPVGADSISARPAPPQAPRAGYDPPPANLGRHPARRDGRAHPNGRRAGCPHPAAPRAAATPAGGYGIRPCDRPQGPQPKGKTATLPGPQPPVGDDARIVPRPRPGCQPPRENRNLPRARGCASHAALSAHALEHAQDVRVGQLDAPAGQAVQAVFFGDAPKRQPLRAQRLRL